MGPRRILFVSNTSWYLYNFRLSFARFLRERGFTVEFLAPADGYEAKIREAGFVWNEWPLHRRSLSPHLELLALLRLLRAYRSIKPDLVHHFTVKPVFYGSLAARFAGIGSVVNSVTGLGHLFLGESTVIRLVRAFLFPLYRVLMKGAGIRFLFQNEEDRALFLREGIVSSGNAGLVKGSGVDTGRFPFEPLARTGEVLFVGRLLKEKGVRELLAAAELLRERGSRARVRLAGAIDEGNPSSLTRGELADAEAKKTAEFLGHVDDIREELRRAELVVLPSYREGLPRTLLEAAAMGRPIVAADVPGCRELIRHGREGLLVPARDPKSLADAIETLLQDEAMEESFRKAARETVEKNFSDEKIFGATLRLYEECFSSQA